MEKHNAALTRLCIVLFSFLIGSCSGLKLSLKDHSVQKPANVALYFSVETRNNIPVAGLSAEHFRIYEDGKLISPYESKQTILNPEVSVAHYILLLMDLSGSITESGTLPTLIEAGSLFADHLSRNQMIAVYGFDGGPELIPIVPLTANGPAVTTGLKRLETYKVKDPSTNLHGAVIKAVHQLNQFIASSKQPLRFGTLVIFTDGTDRAHRASEDSMYAVLRNSDLNVFAIGMGGEISSRQLRRMSTVDYIQADDLAQIAGAFERVAELIEAASRKFYLLSYCSPARAGRHTLKVELDFAGQRGSLSQEFDATGFGPGCDPGRTPNFKATRVTLGATQLPKETSPVPEVNKRPANSASQKTQYLHE